MLSLDADPGQGQIFLLVDIQDFFQIESQGGGGGSKNEHLTGHFRSFFFLISPKQTVKLVK